MTRVHGLTGAVIHAIEIAIKAEIKVLNYILTPTDLKADIVVKREDAMKVIEAVLPLTRSLDIQEECDEVVGINGNVRRVSRDKVRLSVLFYTKILDTVGEQFNE